MVIMFGSKIGLLQAREAKPLDLLSITMTLNKNCTFGGLVIRCVKTLCISMSSELLQPINFRYWFL